MSEIPVIDLFAGPGGLGEGFASFSASGRPRFRLVLSVECEPNAFQTLLLRAFVREFHYASKRPPQDYRRLLAGQIDSQTLFARWPHEFQRAQLEACQARLGCSVGDAEVLDRVRALRRRGVDLRKSIIIGGPPCQAYSLVGRARMSRAKALGDYEVTKDARHVLYREYIRLIEEVKPAAFVMENVRGLLSSTYSGSGIFAQILDDFRERGYDIHALGPGRSQGRSDVMPQDFLVDASCYGVPQRRARIFVIGTRRDLAIRSLGLGATLRPGPKRTVGWAMDDLPRLRSGLSGATDDAGSWFNCVREAAVSLMDWLPRGSEDIRGALRPMAKVGARFPSARCVCRVPGVTGSSGGLVINHETRGHQPADLRRYLFYSCWARCRGYSPTLDEVPRQLLPQHQNVRDALAQGELSAVPFLDRFRVQLSDEPATTVTAHISKDGHYFIHPDPWQCRSLTVREAARLQTFPDDYLFCGSRTEQYRQVGNAVPPHLARQIARVVLAAVA